MTFLICFSKYVMPKADTNAAERLIDTGRVIESARQFKTRADIVYVNSLAPAVLELAKRVSLACRDNPALMLKAQMDGWSVAKIRAELDKLGI